MGGGLIIASIISTLVFLVPMINWMDSDEKISPEVMEGTIFGIILFWFMITVCVWAAYIKVTDRWESK